MVRSAWSRISVEATVRHQQMTTVDKAARNSSVLINNAEAMNQLLSLISRTDDSAITFEVTRLFVNIARSLASCALPDRQEAFIRISNDTIISALVDMLRKGRQYPVVVNESIIALALLSTFGPRGTGRSDGIVTLISVSSILRDLQFLPSASASEETPSNRSGLEILCSIIAPNSNDESLSAEVQANALTLLDQLGKEECKEADNMRMNIRRNIETLQERGHLPSPGVSALLAAWYR